MSSLYFIHVKAEILCDRFICIVISHWVFDFVWMPVFQNVQNFDKLLHCDQTSWDFLGVILVMNESVFQRSMTRYMYGLWSKFRTFLIVIGHKNPMKNVVRLFSWSPCCQTKSLKSADQRVELVGGKWEHWTWIDSIHWKAFVLRPWNTSERNETNELHAILEIPAFAF